MSSRVKFTEGAFVSVITRDYGPIMGTLTELTQESITLTTDRGHRWIISGRQVIRMEDAS